MDRIDPLAQCQCWVDIFEADHFMGRMRRLVGPRKLRQLHGKSVIVGPRATLLLTVRRGGRDVVVKLASKRVVPDLRAAVRGAAIRRAAVAYPP